MEKQRGADSPAGEPETKLEKGMPTALWYFIIPSVMFLIWAMFFKGSH